MKPICFAICSWAAENQVFGRLVAGRHWGIQLSHDRVDERLFPYKRATPNHTFFCNFSRIFHYKHPFEAEGTPIPRNFHIYIYICIMSVFKAINRNLGIPVWRKARTHTHIYICTHLWCTPIKCLVFWAYFLDIGRFTWNFYNGPSNFVYSTLRDSHEMCVYIFN